MEGNCKGIIKDEENYVLHNCIVYESLTGTYVKKRCAKYTYNMFTTSLKIKLFRPNVKIASCYYNKLCPKCFPEGIENQ